MKKLHLLRVLCRGMFALSVAAFAAPLFANGFSSTAFVASPAPVSGGLFGDTVAADGDFLVAGAPGQGTVYVYELAASSGGAQPTWALQATLHAPDGFAGDGFGAGVAIQGHTLVAAAPNARDAQGQGGAAYVFANDDGSWTLRAKLTPADASVPVDFGGGTNGVAIDGGTIAIGASGAPSSAAASVQPGAVYVFTGNGGTWSQQAKIVPNDPGLGEFGFAVALQKDTLVAGAFGTTTAAGSEAGAGFVYARSNGAWTQQARFDSPVGAPFALFGIGVSLDGDTAVVGAPGINAATVYVRSNGAWSLQQMIEGPVLNEDGDFGTGLKLSGDTLLVTAYEDFRASDGLQTGRAFVYRRGGSTWTDQADLTMEPGSNGIPAPAVNIQRFGNVVTMAKVGSATEFVMGSPGLSDPSAQIGSEGGVYTAILN